MRSDRSVHYKDGKPIITRTPITAESKNVLQAALNKIAKMNTPEGKKEMAQELVERRMTAVEEFVDKCVGGNNSQMMAALPSHIDKDRFKRGLYNVVMANPDFRACDHRMVAREVSRAAALGLELEPALGEAYLVPMRTQAGKVPSFRVGYKGLIKLSRQSGLITQVYAREIREGDFVDYEEGIERKLIHKPLIGNRKPIICFYAVAVWTNGYIDFEIMAIDDINAIRDRSDAYKAFKRKLIKSTPWDSDYNEMARKTVVRKLCKRLPQAQDIASKLQEIAADRGSISGAETTVYEDDGIIDVASTPVDDAVHVAAEDTAEPAEEVTSVDPDVAKDTAAKAPAEKVGAVDVNQESKALCDDEGVAMQAGYDAALSGHPARVPAAYAHYKAVNAAWLAGHARGIEHVAMNVA